MELVPVVPLSIPSAYLITKAVGNTLFEFPLYFRYSVSGALVGLLPVAILSALASVWPALQAARMSVREALAYE